MTIAGFHFSRRTLLLDILGGCVVAAGFWAVCALVIAMGPAS